jgi:hypothetical protein
MPKAIVPVGYTIADRERIFGNNPDGKLSPQRKKEQKLYRTRKRQQARAESAAKKAKNKKKK